MTGTGIAVFIDFDGTITTVDTGVYLLDRLAPSEWRAIEDEYKSGRIGSRECMERQWSLLPKDRALIEAVVGQVPLDPGLPQLVEELRAIGAEMTIVSDGYGLRAQEVGSQIGVPVLCNSIDWDAFTVVFSSDLGLCPCSSCGTCKRLPIEHARERGKFTVLIGDGMSDALAAQVADLVFAKGELEARCIRMGIPVRRWTSLSDIARLMGDLAV